MSHDRGDLLRPKFRDSDCHFAVQLRPVQKQRSKVGECASGPAVKKAIRANVDADNHGDLPPASRSYADDVVWILSNREAKKVRMPPDPGLGHCSLPSTGEKSNRLLLFTFDSSLLPNELPNSVDAERFGPSFDVLVIKLIPANPNDSSDIAQVLFGTPLFVVFHFHEDKASGEAMLISRSGSARTRRMRDKRDLSKTLFDRMMKSTFDAVAGSMRLNWPPRITASQAASSLT
ncbi:MAG: hypothetical protein IPK83_03950 [Planctomycetes bacterium]|nr:hypothetical protein [Planctomycetota bacterium]